MSRLLKFWGLSGADRWLLIEAMGWLCWAKTLLWIAPFRYIAPRLGDRMRESPFDMAEAQSKLAASVSWGVRTVARHVPFGFVCLPQAMAAKWMLRRRRLPSTLYLGVRVGESIKMTAHAWLRAGDKILTGRAGSLNHQVVASFGENHPS